MKKIIFFFSLILCISLAFALVSCSGGGQYEEANALFDAGKYEEALAIYETLGDYKDSAARAIFAKNINKINNGDYKNTVKDILKAGVEVTISYDVNGGELDGGNSKTSFTYKAATEFRDVKEIEKKDFEFEKWEMTLCKFTDSGLELSLKALWNAETYGITYNLDGGELDGGVEEYQFGKETALVNPVKTGYTFAGWTGEGVETPTVEIIIPSDAKGEREYTAHWTADSYTVTLDLDGGTADSSTVSVKFGEYYELPKAEKTGFRFGGWYMGETKHTASGEWSTANDVSLKAKWLPRYTISILGDSISTYEGYSNNTDYNSGIGNNAIFFGTDDTKKVLDSVNDTYWMSTINELNLELCVPNGCGASRVTDTLDTTRPGYENVRTGMARANELHRDGDNEMYPDIIFVLLGTNDVGNGVSVAEFKPAYKELLQAIKQNYPDAKLYVGTLIPQNRNVTKELNDEYNAAIKSVAEEMGITVVDIAAESGITWDNYTENTVDNLHPNKTGMAKIATCLTEALRNDFPQE